MDINGYKLDGNKLTVEISDETSLDEAMRALGRYKTYSHKGNEKETVYLNAVPIVEMFERAHIDAAPKVDALIEKYKDNPELLKDIYDTFSGLSNRVWEKCNEIGYDFSETFDNDDFLER